MTKMAGGKGRVALVVAVASLMTVDGGSSRSSDQAAAAQQLALMPGAPRSCPITLANAHSAPQNEWTGPTLGNGWIWVNLYPWNVVLAEPRYVDARGITVKFGWYRKRTGARLTITGQRLDAIAPPARVGVPSGYQSHFQASGITFPTPGCWKVTGHVAGKSLSFVTLVLKVSGIQPNFMYGSP